LVNDFAVGDDSALEGSEAVKLPEIERFHAALAGLAEIVAFGVLGR